MDTSVIASTEIWDEPERPQTLADISFAPTSIDNVEFPDDIAPVAYQANRATMSNNGKKELEQLESLNQQTTAYPTLACTVGPMAPNRGGGPACDVGLMEERSHGITAYSGGRPLFPHFYGQQEGRCYEMEQQGVGMTHNPNLVARASGEPPIGYGKNSYSLSPEPVPKTKPVFKHMSTRMLNSVRGALYDLQHFNELPPAQSGEAPSQVAMYALTRDNRLPYILLLITFVLIMVAAVCGVRTQLSPKPTTPTTRPPPPRG